MSDLFWLAGEQTKRLRPYFTESHGESRLDGRGVLSGIVFVNMNGPRWHDAPSGYHFRKNAPQPVELSGRGGRVHVDDQRACYGWRRVGNGEW